MSTTQVSIGRSCKSCTKCCEGWLKATIDNVRMFPGKPCQYVDIGKGCSNYKNRPKNPCAQFVCSWLVDPTVPSWMEPHKINVVIVEKQLNGITYASATPTGGDVGDDVLSWLLDWGLAKYGNIQWFNRYFQPYYAGSSEFVAAMEGGM